MTFTTTPSPLRSACGAALLLAATLSAAPVQAARPDAHQRAESRYDHRQGHAYPPVGYRVARPPPSSSVVLHARSRYWFADGVWYAGRHGGYVVTRPPIGLHVHALPAFAAVLAIGALSYHYVNGTYYRAVPQGGYEVVEAPAHHDDPGAPGTAPRVYVYPRDGQSAQQQAADEYDCHRWAAGQSGYDPTRVATGQSAPAGGAQRDYQRATGACLEGRGYSLR